ncbi:hydantoinase [Litorimonas cladophorae]|uniref:Hydantoinase n=1 Tax=Litorimonas cladophorae TaxID=1220491 RepID=A0A918KRF5_9PROT|nr:hydantoinase/oxoprolinase family protein [Litorimonas cladophorae]GGX73122.1 hydantoinase [Litorimonas cladophorae]
MRIGIDVGGTHTDAVILNGDDVIAATKALTSADVISGVTAALDEVLKQSGVSVSSIRTVMIGTTQFTNAIIERRELSRAAVIRIGLPSGRGMPPMVDWPQDMIDAIDAEVYMLHGGYLYNGWPVADMRDDEVNAAVSDIQRKGIKNVSIASAFSPMNNTPETQVAEKVRAAIPDARITLSHSFGRLGLMERENAAIMNTTLLPFADRVVTSFLGALAQRGLTCPAFISQNDGTLMNADFVRAYPALTFASGPTNSLRGAYKLTGLENAIVVDIGGTTSDIGVIQNGFPRESNVIVNVGGIRTNFRMPDILAIGLGGGSLVSSDGRIIGPQSVGHKLVTEGLVFGGRTLTTTDILVASGHSDIGDKARVAHLAPEVVTQATATMHTMLNDNIEMMKPGGKDMPVILVGGGAVLVTDGLNAASKLHRPENAGVANAIGAAIAQVGGESERMLSYRQTPRAEAIASVTRAATDRAIKAGADRATIRAVDIEETAVPYMDEGATRVRVKVIGELAQ